MQTHYHVRRHDGEEDPFVTTDLYRALDYVADELREMRDMQYEYITALGDSEDYKGAYRSFQQWETLSNLKDNLDNVVHQHNTQPSKRAPLFRGDGDDMRKPDYYGDTSPLRATAVWVMELVQQSPSTGTLDFYACSAIDVIADEDGEWHESYSPSGQ